jgi:hypothetical protein
MRMGLSLWFEQATLELYHLNDVQTRGHSGIKPMTQFIRRVSCKGGPRVVSLRYVRELRADHGIVVSVANRKLLVLRGPQKCSFKVYWTAKESRCATLSQDPES